MSPAPKARQPERTRLAWQRTMLSALIALLTVERLVAAVSAPVTWLLVGLSVAALLPPGVALVRARAAEGPRIDGRALLLLSVTVVLVGVAGLAYAVLD